ncbi:MAG: TonB-dependent receptor [Bryobacteraceae bacterium]
MMAHPIAFTYLLGFCLAANLHAASTRGRVLDPSGAAVIGATVTIRSRDASVVRSTTSGFDGVYSISQLPSAHYLIVAAAEGFSDSETVSFQLDDTREQNLAVGLARLSTQVSVTASSTTQSTDEIAKAFDVIDGKEIAARGEYSLVEALRLTPGIRIMQLGGPGSLARIHTRGLRAFDTSLLIDGFRFRDVAAPQSDGTGFFGDFVLLDTARVEVLRGSGSSLYGTHAIGGVVNMVTGAGGAPFHGEISAEGGGLGLFRGVARAGGGLLDDRLRFSGAMAHLNVTSGVDGYDATRNWSGQGFAQYALSPRTTAGIRVFANDTFLSLNGTPFAAPVAALPTTLPVPAVEGRTFFTAPNDPDSGRLSSFVSALATLTHQISPSASLRAQYQGMTTRRNNRDGPGGTGFQPQGNNSNQFDGRIDTAQARTDLTLFQRHFVSAGYEFEREDYNNRSRDPLTDARVTASQRSHALFAQDQWRLAGDRLQVSLSGRFQNFALSRPAFAGGNAQYANVTLPSPPNALTGDVALSYFVPKTGTKLRAHTGNAYRAPALYERFGYSFFAGSFSAYGDPRIAPERSIAFDAGFDQYLASSRIQLSGTYFYTRLQQVIGFDFSGLISAATDPYGRSLGYRNTGGGLARGVELSVRAQLTRSLYAQAAYTHTNADERNSVLLGGSVRSIRVSPHTISAMVTQRLWRSVDVTFDFFGASSYWWQMFSGGARPFLFPGPKKGDLAINYTKSLGERTRMVVFTRIDNIFNQSYFEDGFRTPKAWAIGGLRFAW